MQSTDIPYKLMAAWANAASASYVTATIPTASQQTSGTPNAASLADGFPPDTFTPSSAGGKGPQGQDMNGILQIISKWVIWQQSGGQLIYDSTFSIAIGGYPAGAVLNSTSLGKRWQSVVNNNTTDPDGASPSGWISVGGFRGGSFGPSGSLGNTGTTNWTVPAGVYSVHYRVWGGGGGGGGSVSQPSAASGGGGGGYCEGIATVTPAQVIAVTAGVGGNLGAAATSNSGSAGGPSSFGSFCTAYGGGQGLGATSGVIQSASGAGGGVSGGNILNIAGTNGSVAFNITTSPNISYSGAGGHAFSGAGSPGTFGTATSGETPGGGGAGGANGGAGGAGGPGLIVIAW